MNKLVFFILIVLLFPTLGADVISINSGGSNELVINPDTYIEGFFSCIPYTCSVLGYGCGTWSDGCGGTLDCGTCASGYTCTSGVCIAKGGGGGGGGGGGELPPNYVLITPAMINLSLTYNPEISTSQRVVQKIHIQNVGYPSLTFSVTTSNLTGMVFPQSNSVTVNTDQTAELIVDIVSPLQDGNFLGNIILESNTTGKRNIPVFIHVTSNPFWFDSNIVVLNKDYLVEQGDKLETQVTLIPMGDPTRLDVTLNYVIKDYKNKIYLTQKETLLVEKQMNFKRDFDTGILPIGKYIVGLELVYPGGIAPSSAHFEVIEKVPLSFFGKVIYFLIIMILLVLIIIIALLIRRFAKQRKAQRISFRQK